MQAIDRLRWAVGLVLFACSTASPAMAQVPRGCHVTQLTDPPRQVLQCRDGLIIEAERDAVYRLRDRDGDGRTDTAEVSARGLLVEMPPGRRGGFQIVTPHAIAAVRGTIYAADVSETRTSVFVSRGRVAVRKRIVPGAVLLQAGDGVDVTPDSPLSVTRWSPERAAGLLARFGRQ